MAALSVIILFCPWPRNCSVFLQPFAPPTGFNPRWDCTLGFQLQVPELAMVRFVVEDHDHTAKNDFVGQFTLPFTSLRTGAAQTSRSPHRSASRFTLLTSVLSPQATDTFICWRQMVRVCRPPPSSSTLKCPAGESPSRQCLSVWPSPKPSLDTCKITAAFWTSTVTNQ